MWMCSFMCVGSEDTYVLLICFGVFRVLGLLIHNGINGCTYYILDRFML